MKGFQSKKMLLFQLNFSRIGKEKKNRQIVYYEEFPDGSHYVKFDNRYWGLMPFLSGTCLDFSQIQDQQEAFSCLHQFHLTYQGVCDHTNERQWRLIPKWTYRIHLFHYVLDFIPVCDRSLFYDMLHWGYYALSMLANEPVEAMEKQAIINKTWIHGDVAPHNFIRLSDDDIRLMDFDLVAIAPNSYDLLQLANRILVCNGWDLHDLCVSIPKFEEMLKQRWFVLSLIYPSDLFREWNKFFFERSDVDRFTLLEYSEKQFALRIPSVRQMIHMIN